MAETVYKSIPDLDVLSGSLDGSETLPVVKSGKTYRRSWTNFFGSGWMAQLLQAFSSFVAPNATHADDADTVGGENLATLHNAANLTGNINLDRIPEFLTGKKALANGGNSATCGGVDFVNGNAGTKDFFSVPANSAVIIPKGTYMAASSSGIVLAIWWDSYWNHPSSGSISGLIVSDGVNFAAFNNNTVAGNFGYIKLA